ncbi:MAG: phosphatase PAP2 family protein [Patescibacteria group bacterium]
MNILDQLRFYDYHIYLFFHGAIHGRPYLNEFYLFFAKYGIIFFFLAFIYLIVRGRIYAFVCAFFSSAMASLLDIFIGLIFKRPRPFVSHNAEVLTPIITGLRVDRLSFPSAHTYLAFAIATSIFLYGHRKLGILLYFLAILVAVGRMGAGLHYPSDVTAGALLGISTGIISFLAIEKYERKHQD